MTNDLIIEAMRRALALYEQDPKDGEQFTNMAQAAFAVVSDRIEALTAEVERLAAAVKAQMDGKHKEAAEAKLWFTKAQEWKAENARLREAVGILEDGLQEVGDDYPGSSCQEWCQHQIKQARAALEKHHD